MYIYIYLYIYDILVAKQKVLSTYINMYIFKNISMCLCIYMFIQILISVSKLV